MPIRTESNFFDLKGKQYRITVDDENYVNDPTMRSTFKAGGDGFTLTYEGQNLDRFNSVIPSKLSFSMYIENANDEVIISDLANSQEGRFKVKVEENDGNGNWSKYWVGVILTDQVNYQDEYYPFPFRITAVDQIATLSKVDYNNNGVAYEGPATLLEHLYNILNKTYAPFFYATNEDFIGVAGDWLENNHVLADDPMVATRVNHIGFNREDQDGNKVYFSCLKILKEIALAMGSRFYQSRGKFVFEKINQKAGVILPMWIYDKAGSFLKKENSVDAALIGHGQSVELLAGATYTFLPPLKSVKLSYNHASNRNLILGSFYNSTNSANLEVGEITSNLTTSSLSFSANLYIKLKQNTAFSESYRFTWALRMKYKDKYINRQMEDNGFGIFPSGPIVWQTAIGDYIISTDWIQSGQVLNIPINFQTPVMPDPLGNLSFDFSYENIHANNGPITGTAPIFVEYWELEDAVLELFDDGTPQSLEASRLYQINNDQGTRNTETLEYETILGDAYTYVTRGKMQILNSLGAWEDSTDWAINQSAPFLSIMKLLILEIMAGQKTAIKILRGTVKGNNVFPTTKLVRNGEEFIFMGGGYNAIMEEWSGEWFQLKIDRTGLSFGVETSEGGSNTTGGSGTTSSGSTVVASVPIRENFTNVNGATITIVTTIPTDTNRNFLLYRDGRLLIVVEDFTIAGQNVNLIIPAIDENFTALIYN